MIRIVRAQSNEALVIHGRKGGKLAGTGIVKTLSVFTNYSLINVSRIRVDYNFVQETADQISTRFKGTVFFRIADPVLAAKYYAIRNRLDRESLGDDLIADVIPQIRNIGLRYSYDEVSTMRNDIPDDFVEEIRDKYSVYGLADISVILAQIFPVDKEIINKKSSSEIERLNRIEEEARLEREKAVALKEIDDRMSIDRSAYKAKLEKLKADTQYSEQSENDRKKVRLLELENEAMLLEQEKFSKKGQSALLDIASEGKCRRMRSEFETNREKIEMENRRDIINAAADLYSNAQLSLFGGEGSETLTALNTVVKTVSEALGVSEKKDKNL